MISSGSCGGGLWSYSRDGILSVFRTRHGLHGVGCGAEAPLDTQTRRAPGAWEGCGNRTPGLSPREG